MKIQSYSKKMRPIAMVDKTEVIHSKGYVYTVYGELAPHQVAANKKGQTKD